MKRKLFSVALATIVAVMAISGASLAWLQDTTDTVTNTFTEGLVDIELNETTGDSYKMVPGSDIEKDPTVTVLANSEACWLFVKIDESENFDDFMTYDITDGWTELSEGSGVYYREVSAADAKAGVSYPVLAGNKVTVKGEEVTLGMMEELNKNTNNRPTLSFTAYAVQQVNVATPQAAWDIINPANAG